MTPNLSPLSSFNPSLVWENALRILSEIGFAVESETVRRKISGQLREKGGRVCFPREIVEHYAEELRRKSAAERRPPDGKPGELSLFNIGLSSYWFDPAAQSIRPYDTATMVKHTKFVYQMARERSFVPNVVGYPLDVPPRIQFLTLYYLHCLYNPGVGAFCLANTLDEMRFNLEIAGVLGVQPVFGTEMISPLKFMGGSIDIAFALYRDGMAVSVDPMPIIGVTAPMDWHAAWGLSVAENIGCYVIFRLCGVADVRPTFRLFPPNMTAGMTYFSSPKHLAAMLTRRAVREFFGMATDGAEFLLVTSKAPDQQAAIEKTAGCLAAATHGFRYLEGAGSLWIDEVFSPQQLLIDLEIRDFVHAMRADLAPSGLNAIDEISRGVEAGSFLSTDCSLDHFEDFIWRPRLFDLGPRAAWDRRALLSRVKPQIEEKAAQYEYELGGVKREEIERIMERARKKLS